MLANEKKKTNVRREFFLFVFFNPITIFCFFLCVCVARFVHFLCVVFFSFHSLLDEARGSKKTRPT